MYEFNDNSVFFVADGVRAREEEFGLLVVSRTTPALSLNADCKFLWNLIDGNRPVREIVSAVEDAYEGDTQKESTLQCLETFRKLGLVYFK